MATLTLRGLRKSFGSLEIIKGIDLDIADRAFVVFVGPSGCGKSTLLRMIAGLEPITGGELRINNVRVNEVRAADRGLAMVFQSYALYPHMTVRQNMGFALRLAGTPRAERDRKVTEAARILQLEPCPDRRPKDLSGGQRQRVAIGRAIVRQPKVFLFDEPLSNLDAALRGQTRVELLRLHADLKTTMIYVTHDQVEAMTMADTIVVLQAGRVEQVGSPLELYHHPQNLFVAGFIGSPRMNLVPGVVAAADAGVVTVTLPWGSNLHIPVLPDAVKRGQAVTLGIRPETLQPELNGLLRGEVRLVEHLGGLTLLHVDTEHDGPLTVQTDGTTLVKPQQPIRLAVDAPSCHVFDAAGEALQALVRHRLTRG